MTKQITLKQKLFESTSELCEAIMNWIVSNRKSLSRSEFENFTKRVMLIQKKIGVALGKSKIGDCYLELINLNKELKG